MKPITRQMIDDFGIRKLGYDFMGYKYAKLNDLTFHHLVVPKKDCKAQGLGEGYVFWNGAILTQNPQFSSSHDYLHLIERYKRSAFLEITNQMIIQNKQGRIDRETLRKIREVLLYFEDEFKNERDRNGKFILKKQFLQNRVDIYEIYANKQNGHCKW